ncbi:MAG: RloB family protein [Herminiimonas sp.]|uniref:RloB family protein n=1 Tax=Herminiimonas sp. TaxID=1926289 RepID=UPI0027249E20|nr:RloB family protein [Herminiimonas sp.]MDO9420012.1 RloB family protein [Herminiimonas sp.]
MARNADSFKRIGQKFKPQPKVLLICEDLKSGKQYFEEARAHFRVDVEVEVLHCGRTDPKGIVEAALKRSKAYEQIFCIIDRDSHQNFDEALVLSESKENVNVIASYPCFEYWLLIHFGHICKPYSSVGNHSAADRLIADLRKHPGMAEYAKGNIRNLFSSFLGEPFNQARKTSPIILKAAIENGEMNPSTGIHEVFDAFEALAQPIQVQDKK